jgi:hypothetical protein
MALVKKDKPAVAATGTFEDVNETQVIEHAETLVEGETAAPTVGDKAKVAATVAIATAKNTAIAASAPKFQAALAEYENALPAVDFGVLPRLKGSNGLILDGDNGKLGSKIKLTLISFNDQFVISPGVDDADATKFVRYSLDGITIDSTGESVADYVQRLKTVEGYEDADIKKYAELVGILNESEKESEHVGNMVQISLSPQSRKSFEAYRLQRSVKQKMGRIAEGDAGDELVISAVVKTMGNYTFTILQVTDK